jgi:hypothetical protein
MKYIINLLLFLAFIPNALGQAHFAQVPYAFSSESVAPLSDDSSRVVFKMVDATDGHTAETGLTVSCQWQEPRGVTFATCIESVVGIGNGFYSVRLRPNERQYEGNGVLRLTASGARDTHVTVAVVKKDVDTNIVRAPMQFSDGQWTKTAVTITSDSFALSDTGYTLADTITGDGTDSRHCVSQGVNVKMGQYLSRPDNLWYASGEVRYNSLGHAWVGVSGSNYIGGNIALSGGSTGEFTPNDSPNIRGVMTEAGNSGWLKWHMLFSLPTSNSTAYIFTCLGDGTAGTISTGAPTNTSTGTIYATRLRFTEASNISPYLIERILPKIGSAGASTIVLANDAVGSNDFYNDRSICIYGATRGEQCRCITDYVGSTKLATVNKAWISVPTSANFYKLGGACLNDVNSVNTVTATTNANVVSMASDTITASAVATDTITDVKMSTAARNAIADTIWRRSSTNIEGSSYGDTLGYKSGYGVIAQQTHKSNASLGVQTVYKADGTTVLNSRSYNSNPSAEPITGLD